jgi:hypothetical protein
LAKAVCAVIDMGGLNMLVESFRAVKEGEAEDARCMLPKDF